VSETTLVAVRHGETPWNRAGRMQGWAPVGLTDRGREQARAVGDRLAGAGRVDRVVASDTRRTRETTALLRERGSFPRPTFEAGWRERGLGDYQGLTREHLFDRHPAFDYEEGWLSVEIRPPGPGGESVLDMRERVVDAAADLLARATGERVLVVTHGGPVQALLSAATDADVLACKRRTVGNCSVTVFEGSSPADLTVRRVDDTG